MAPIGDVGAAWGGLGCPESWKPFLSQSTRHYLGGKRCPELPSGGECGQVMTPRSGREQGRAGKLQGKHKQSFLQSLCIGPKSLTRGAFRLHPGTRPCPQPRLSPQCPPPRGASGHGKKKRQPHDKARGSRPGCPVPPEAAADEAHPGLQDRRDSREHTPLCYQSLGGWGGGDDKSGAAGAGPSRPSQLVFPTPTLPGNPDLELHHGNFNAHEPRVCGSSFPTTQVTVRGLLEPLPGTGP